jgi:hypothetical protein
MLQGFDCRPDDNVNEPRIFCPNKKRSDTDYLELMVNTSALLFMGEIAKVISI